MPKITVHKDYQYNLSEVKKCKDCYAGDKTIKAANELYLPKLVGTGNKIEERYIAYKNRSLFLNGMGKTIDVFAGMIQRKETEIATDSDEIKTALQENVTETQTLDSFIVDVIVDVLQTGKSGILVDYQRSEDETEIVSQEDAEKAGLSAKFYYYPYSSIIDWGNNNNYYVLEEIIEVYKDNDIFEKEEILQRKALDIESESGYYRQRIFRKDTSDTGKNNDNWLQFGEDRYPTINGKKLDYIPFYVIETGDKPPLLELADICIQWYQVYADYRSGIHFTGFPQAVIIGHKADTNKDYIIGSDTAWTIKETNASVQYLEYKGSGLKFPAELLDKLEDKMAQFGTRMLIQEKKTSESARKAEIDRSGEASALGLIANIISYEITNACKVLLQWNQVSSDIVEIDKLKVQLNTDYIASTIDPALLKELLAAKMAGGMSFETYWSNLQTLEVGSTSKTADDEKALIDKDDDRIMNDL